MELTANEIINNLGGTARTAELCEVTQSAVSQWRTDGIPKHQMKFIRAVRPKALKRKPDKVQRVA